MLWTNVAVLALGLVMLLFARGPIADVASGFFASMTGEQAAPASEHREEDAGRPSSDREASIQIISASPPHASVDDTIQAAQLRLALAVRIASAETTDSLPDHGTTP